MILAINDDTIIVTNVGSRAALLVTITTNDLENYGFHAPIDGLCLDFQTMGTKAKDGLVLSIIWRWEVLRVVTGSFFYHLAIL